jgi:hypothetical protein
MEEEEVLTDGVTRVIRFWDFGRRVGDRGGKGGGEEHKRRE